MILSKAEVFEQQTNKEFVFSLTVSHNDFFFIFVIARFGFFSLQKIQNFGDFNPALGVPDSQHSTLPQNLHPTQKIYESFIVPGMRTPIRPNEVLN